MSSAGQWLVFDSLDLSTDPKYPKCSAYPRPHHAEGVYIIKPQGNARYPRDDIRRTSCGDDMPSLRLG